MIGSSLHTTMNKTHEDINLSTSHKPILFNRMSFKLLRISKVQVLVTLEI